MNDEQPKNSKPPTPGDRPQPEVPASSKTQLADDFVMAIRFFSRLPTGDRPHQKPDLTRIATVLPFASLLIGALPALILAGGALAGLPTLFAAGLAVGVAAIVSGAMAEDAIADAADGLFGGGSPARRLEIMKDSRHGTYGVIALCLFLLLRVAALSAMAAIDPLAAGAVWLAAMLMARSGALWLTVSLPAARPDGVSSDAGRVSRHAFSMGALFALIVGLLLAAPSAGLPGFITAVALVAAIAWGWTDLCRRLVGGQTGDLIGALQALLEIAALTAFLLFV